MIKAQVRITSEVMQEMKTILFSRYPEYEWATFFLFGYRKAKLSTGEDVLVITISKLLPPQPGDLNPDVGHVEIRSQYSLRAALTAEKTPLCVGVVHSHPEGYRTRPSTIDDDMDSYYPEYFRDFTKTACYCSLIYANDKRGNFSFSGRGLYNDTLFEVEKIITVSDTEIQVAGPMLPVPANHYTQRVEDVYGSEAQIRLFNSTVTIVGCGGTGSAAAHILARSGVNNFILIDFDRLEDSNLEKLHGAEIAHMKQQPRPYKVEVVRDMILSINPNAIVVPIVGNILQDLSKNYAVASDLIFCCTDSSHSRVGVSEIAYRYLVPSIDIGVQLAGDEQGKVSAEVVQFVKYTPDQPCSYCRGLVDKWRLAVELMTEEEKEKRKKESAEAAERGDHADNYWRDVPALHSVGHLTTLAAAVATSYGMGWITNKFNSAANFFQFNLIEEDLGHVRVEMDKRPKCACSRIVGYADQGLASTVISAPSHWSDPFIL